MKHYGFCIKFTTQPGKRDELVAILLQSADLLKSTDSCLHYLVSITNEPDEVWVYETWASKEAHDAALQLQEAKVLIQRAIPLIVGASNKLDTQVIGGKGL